ncbi:MAG: HAMP domain-containing histidine kinase, partial [Proteobacteria bacterium]
FIRFALLGIFVSGLFLALSILTTNWMRNLIFDEPFRDRGPFRAFELLLDKISPEQRLEALRGLRAEGPGRNDRRAPPPGSGAMQGPTVEMVLLDSEGVLIFPEELDPEKLSQVSTLVDRLKSGTDRRVLGETYAARRLSGEPAQYFARALRLRPPPPPFGTILFLSSIQLASIIAAVLVTLAVVLFSLRARARQADAVMKELSAGNLKARLQITKMDEVGQTMFSFNKMADEIEHLIEHLRKTENARKDLLRELAHDLRTPVASLKSLIETVSMRADQLPKEKLRDLLELAMKEAEYFEGLVDDLLFLGRVGEPKYKTKVENFDLADLVSLEVDSASTRYPEIEVTLQSSADVLEYDG